MDIQATDIRIEGNTVYITADPAIGVLALTAFTDNSAGVDGTHYFVKNFRYSSNGVTWSAWQPLTVPNITAITVAVTDTLVIELSYLKVQPLGDDVLSISEATISSNQETIENGQYFQGSIFSQFFNATDVSVLKWYVSVLEKLYQKGLIPSFIERLNEFGLPDDFVDFWKSICKFFAYFVMYARAYQNFPQNSYLLSEYLEERGLTTSINNTLTELQYLMQNYNRQIFNRGTIHIIDKIMNNALVDGELLRLIYYNDSLDEFLFNLYKTQHFGWNLGNSSPLHRGLYLNDNLNKSYETGRNVNDITKYPTVGTVAKVTDGNKTVLQLTGSGSGIDPA